jgi:predicted hydrocarbon binding protein
MAEGEVKGVGQESLKGFLKLNAAAGEVRTADNKRVIVVTGELWNALSNSLAQRLSGELDDALYSAGQAWGSAAFSEFSEKVTTSQRTLYHTRNMSLGDFKQEFDSYLVMHGWGRFDIYEKYDLIFIDLMSSAQPELMGRQGTMTCSLMAGFFSGFFSELTGVELGCIELRCAATGAEKCTFVVADSAITASARKWLAKGRSFDEIVAAIGEKEYQGKK